MPQTGNTFQFADNFSKIVGKHSIKFGGDIRYQMFNQTLYYNVNGSINFGPGGANDTGDSYANFLLGLPNSYSQGSARRNWCAVRPCTYLRRTAGRSVQCYVELWIALGNEHTNDGYRAESADVPARPSL